MELSFQTHALTFLKSVVREVRHQEETAETIVPDSYPDIESIIDSTASVILRGKDCLDGSCTISGGIKGGILYQAEGEQKLCTLDYYLPFNMKIDNPELTSQSHVCCELRVRSVDGKMINSRKAMLRVNVSCLLLAYTNAEEICYTMTQQPDSVQVLERTYPLLVPVEYSEKAFSIHETMELPAGTGDMAQIYKFYCRPEITDQKLVGDKAVFRGNIYCKLAYLSADNQYLVHTVSVPFSQYCQLEQTYDEEQVMILLSVTGCDFNQEQENKGRRGEMVLHILGQCVVSGVRELNVIEDAYSTTGTLQTKWKSYHLQSCLDRQKINLSAHQQLHPELVQVVDTEMYTDFPTITNGHDPCSGGVATMARAIGYNAANMLTGASGIGNAVIENLISGQASCIGRVVRSGEEYPMQNMDKLEICQDLQLDLQFLGGQEIDTLMEAEMDTESKIDSNSPSLVLKRVHAESALWDLAKAYHSRVDVICAVNQLDNDRVKADQILLIPIG